LWAILVFGARVPLPPPFIFSGLPPAAHRSRVSSSLLQPVRFRSLVLGLWRRHREPRTISFLRRLLERFRIRSLIFLAAELNSFLRFVFVPVAWVHAPSGSCPSTRSDSSKTPSLPILPRAAKGEVPILVAVLGSVYRATPITQFGQRQLLVCPGCLVLRISVPELGSCCLSLPECGSSDVLLPPAKFGSCASLFCVECLQVIAGFVLESPDQKTRGFLVRITLPR
jgi:hypothetical protein